MYLTGFLSIVHSRHSHEIAATLDGVGVTPNFHKGAADVFEMLEKTPIAKETRQTVDKSRTLKQALAIYVEQLPGAKSG